MKKGPTGPFSLRHLVSEVRHRQGLQVSRIDEGGELRPRLLLNEGQNLYPSSGFERYDVHFVPEVPMPLACDFGLL